KTEESKKQTEAIDSDDIKFAYCTEFMINTNYSDIEAFRNELSELGDSLLAVSGEGIIKVHIHTNNPGIALEKALKLGSLNDIKIDNMRYQHEEILLKDELKGLKEENIEANNKIKDIEINKEYSLISVSIGEGINEIFNDLNVDAIVSGGQTMNPSTEDLLKAIDTTHGKNVIILPNNSNIILAAEQAKELSNRKISVIPTKNIAQGISALLAFNEEATLEENIEIMTNAINTIKSAQVTYAVRDTEYNNNKIIKDDIIGLSDKEILSSGKDINQVSTNLIEQLVDDDTSIITIFFGNNVDEVIANELATTLEGKYENIDIEVIFGGQPLYYYIFSIE
ncbi:MAG: DAK2 domain-containing protein, partial [Tissierellia bacterium]|nr:DAK2 domain-containing protein [Tissierellia bacterium]